jgi:uncharacterized protein YbcI
VPGFRFRYRLNGEPPTIRRLAFKNTATLTRGDLLNLEGDEVNLGAVGDSDLVGVALETLSGTASSSYIQVVTDADAVYGVEDENPRIRGSTLDLIGATGAQGVGTGSDGALQVAMDCTDGQETLVCIKAGMHGELKRTGGRLNAAIANAVVRVHSEYIGRGPTRARAFYRHDMVVVVMQDALTTGERSIATAGKPEAVLELRRQYQEAMKAQMIAAIEELTGHKVVAFMSDNHIEPDISAELFILDRPIAGEHSPGEPV